ncbi:hypothetical protein AB7M45_002239 [Bradyrhizobium elkanii]|uniref:hypothetical protein n=1 Tax=Bradyrhizobium elkanii TaxID=29448 RepID=UPI00030D9627|nr:hypothetical protein [Bradyrhizobium elkanii]MCW2189469.1 hypothetical protein [Bradyrhizobium elkanii]NWL72796.1 hypothetical protein [Bradyrhizobium elkanii]OIM95892.1 hypothetical protein BLN97_02755 [Bradyrhizobium elkanii]
MGSPARPVLRLKGHELVPADEDRRVEIGVYDVLLPCRKYDIAYKIAVLGKVSPTLEFLLRLIKSIPGMPEDSAATFFGYSRSEVTYVINEGLAPGYIERNDGRLWLTAAGDSLFKDDEAEPIIFSVEERSRVIGFDLLAVAPQQPRPVDSVEQWLPELPIDDGAGTGKVAEKIFERFGRFFHELSERRDRDNVQRRDLYSIDKVTPKDRFQAPVRIRAFAQASSPSLPEIDLSSWRPDHEVADRPQVESSAASLVEGLKVTANQLNAPAAYLLLTEFAPEFLKEFTIRNGLAVNRYWREAVSRAGEPRSDRQTVPIVGPLYTEENARRFLSVLEYGLRNKADLPEFVLSVAPQTQHWGATTQQRDTLTTIRRKVEPNPAAESGGLKAVCCFAGKPPRYIERTFDEVHCADTTEIPPALELLIVPRTAIAAIVHAPIGSASGQAVPLGFASFDQDVIARVQSFASDRINKFVQSDEQRDQLAKALSSD